MPEVLVENWGKWRVAWVSDDNVGQVVSCCKEGKVDAVGISRYKGCYKSRDISFLGELASVRCGVVFTDAGRYDLDVLYQLRRLSLLSIVNYPRPMDFSEFEGIEDLTFDWVKGCMFPRSGTKLQRLALGRYKCASRDLSELGDYPELQSLSMVHGNLESLDGIDRFRKLESCELHYVLGMKRIAGIGKTGIVEFELDHCKKVEDLSGVACCKRLGKLIVSDCGEMESIAFIRSMPSLRFFTFVGTTVVDGDMTPLLRLDVVGYNDKKHYTHKLGEVKRIIASHGTTKE